jgi:hypothetical protein
VDTIFHTRAQLSKMTSPAAYDAFAVQEAKNLVGQRAATVIQVRKEAKGMNGHPTMIQPLHAKVVYGTLDQL